MNKQSKWVGLAAIASGVFASACCLGPLVLAGIGLSGVGFSQFFSPYRPYFMGATFLFLAAAFAYTFLPVRRTQTGKKEKPQEGKVVCLDCESPKKRARTRGYLALFTLLALLFAFYPSIASKYAALKESAVQAQDIKAAQNITLSIQGMTCSSCVLHIQKALRKVPGVYAAKVSYESKKADVAAGKDVFPEALVKAVEKEGYRARVILQ